ncbi:MAG: c-type cytochrome [Vicinamibacteria bacterium]|nr:c-type cytochrome [Vicinamibacteria bacterium]
MMSRRVWRCRVVPAGLLLAALSGCAGREAAESGAADPVVGQRVFAQSCSACHGQEGEGTPAAVPPLAGHLPRLAQEPEGRDYLVRVLLWGVVGPVEVGGQAYDGVMAPFDHRSDAELAAVLNYVLTAWGNDRRLPPGHRPLNAAEIAAARREPLTGKQMRERRPGGPAGASAD